MSDLLADLRELRDEAEDKADTTDTDHPNFAMRVAVLLDRVIARLGVDPPCVAGQDWGIPCRCPDCESSRIDAAMRREDMGIEQARKEGKV